MTGDQDDLPIGLLFVHGIGEQARGETLLRFGEPLVRCLEQGLRSGSAAASGLRVNISNVVVSAHPGDFPSSALVTVESGSVATPAEPPAVKWLVAESWWARSFSPPGYLELMWFSLAVAPPLVCRAVTGGINPGSPWKAGASQSFNERVKHGLAGVPRFVDLVFQLLYVLFPILILHQVTILALPVLALVPPLRRWATTGQNWLAAVAGDSYVLASSPIRYGAMASQVRRDIDWLATRTSAIVIVAHSQGAAVTLRALKEHRDPKVDHLITLGSGISKLRTTERLLEQVGPHRVSTLMAAIGTASIGAFIWLAATSHSSGVEQGIFWAGVAAWVLSLAISVRFMGSGADLDVYVPGLEEGGDFNWIDITATNDPVPDAPLDRLRLRQDDSYPLSPYAGLKGEVVSNRLSIFADHTTYFANTEQVLGPMLATLQDVEKRRRSSSKRVIELAPRDVAGTWRAMRVKTLFTMRFLYVISGLFCFVLLGTDRLVSIGETTLDSLLAVTGVLLPDTVERVKSAWSYGRAESWIVGSLLSVVAGLLIYRLTAISAWEIWDRSAARFAFESDTELRLGHGKALFFFASLVPVAVTLTLHWAVDASGFGSAASMMFIIVVVFHLQAMESADVQRRSPRATGSAEPVTETVAQKTPPTNPESEGANAGT